MKIPSTLRLALLVSVFVIRHSTFVMAQGPLAPPGAPAPTMKTLDQVEARTPISSVPFTISAGGSYYLTRNLAVTAGDAIVIDTENVTLDLNGFTLSSTASPASGNGVTVGNGRQNIAIRNGHLKGTTTSAAGVFTAGGFLNGISGPSTCRNVRVSEIEVRAVGGAGIDLASISIASLSVRHCQVTLCAGTGIRAGTVGDCEVETAGDDGIGAGMVSNSFAASVGTVAGSNGIDSNGTVQNCRGIADAGVGLNAVVAINCTDISDSGTGLIGGNATNCTGFSTSGTGLSVSNAMNCSGTSTSGIGLSCISGTNCNGVSASGSFGLRAFATATSCQGQRNSGVAVSAPIAIGCSVTGVPAGTVTSANKFLGTP